MSWFFMALGKYADFSGRARRKEYWYFALFYLIIYTVAIALDAMLGTYLITLIFALAMLVPSISVTVRRLHDTGRSGWWVLIALIPLIGAIVLLVFGLLDSESGSNRFGPNPKAA